MKKYDVVIVGGLGHVGLPLGIVFASKNLKKTRVPCGNESNREISAISGFVLYQKI